MKKSMLKLSAIENGFPTVSIVILKHDGAHLLERLLLSLMRLNYPKFEVLVVDDASGDRSSDFLRKRFSWVKVVRVQSNRGASEGRNKGILASNAQYIAFLDNDTTVEENWLLELVKIAESSNRIGACVSKTMFLSDIKIIDSAGGVCDKFGGARNRGAYERDLGQYKIVDEVPFGATAAMLVKRRILDEIEAFDCDYFVNFEDVDLCWRMRLRGYSIVFVPSSVAYHVRSATRGRDVVGTFHLLERNRLMTIVKNLEGFTLLNVLPVFFSVRLIYLAASILRRRPRLSWALVKAILWNVANIQRIARKRARIQSIRKISDDEFFGRLFYRNSLDLNDAIMFLRGYRPSEIWR